MRFVKKNRFFKKVLVLFLVGAFVITPVQGLDTNPIDSSEKIDYANSLKLVGLQWHYSHERADGC